MDRTGKPQVAGIERPYTQHDVERLRGRFRILTPERFVAELAADSLP